MMTKGLFIIKGIKKGFSVVGKHWHKCCEVDSSEAAMAEYRRVEYGERPPFLNYPDPFSYWVSINWTRKRK